MQEFCPMQDEHLLTVLRYVQRNPLRAGLVERAEDWQWGSCAARITLSNELKALLAQWPVQRPRRWLQRVNEPQTQAEEEAMKQHIARGRPFRNDLWVAQTAKSLHLQQTLRPRGRQKGWRKE